MYNIHGYNYCIYRYRHDLKKYPNRLILGSETFCADAYSFWELAKTEPRLIGDFVWAGMDYIGETGVGRWGYLDYPSQPPLGRPRLADRRSRAHRPPGERHGGGRLYPCGL
ncbi:MAG: hypothetical protein LUG55_09345 [Clostridiales bacterium]|nr:hypothetical protein [Clostridiales bacterium]